MVQRLPVIPFARENQDNILRGLYIDSFMCSTIPELSQNEPNPFSENSVIKYYLPSDTYFAELTISNMEGVSIKTFNLNGKGYGQIMISGGTLKAGTYTYTLSVYSERSDSKRIILL